MARCDRCGKTIFWAKTTEGKNIPIDPAIRIFRVWADENNNILCALGNQNVNSEAPAFSATHFDTCARTGTDRQRTGS